MDKLSEIRQMNVFEGKATKDGGALFHCKSLKKKIIIIRK